MTISAVALFGSQARGDAEPGSDVDMLMITSERRARHVGMGNVSIYLYPWSYLLKAARGGDLFLCHLAREAKPLHDPTARLTALADAFIFKAYYRKEIDQASDLAWYLVHFHNGMDEPTVTKRIAWCVRTILIARSAEQRTPHFAAAELATFSGSPAVRTLIARKEDARLAPDSMPLIREVLRDFGARDPVEDRTPDAYRLRFKDTGNKVALQTLRGSDLSNEYTSIA